MTDTDMLYVASLQKRNEELEARVAELEEKHFSECAQIAHYSDELAKAKELLKAAVEGLDNCAERCICDYCDSRCPFYNFGCVSGWKYRDEALALIGGGENGT